MAETKQPGPAAPGKDVKAAGPMVHVKATVPCYIDGVYYFAGDEFDVEESAFNDQAMEKVSTPRKG